MIFIYYRYIKKEFARYRVRVTAPLHINDLEETIK